MIRSFTAENDTSTLRYLFAVRGRPRYLRSDNGPEFTAKKVRHWLEQVEVRTLFIQPGSPWENGYVESFHGKLRAELINREIFDTLLEAKVLIERWRRYYNTLRPHSSLGYRPPAPEAIDEHQVADCQLTSIHKQFRWLEVTASCRPASSKPPLSPSSEWQSRTDGRRWREGAGSLGLVCEPDG